MVPARRKRHSSRSRAATQVHLRQIFSFPIDLLSYTEVVFLRYSKQGIIWGVVESKLRELLQESAIVCVANQQLSDEQAKKYFFSGLQKNIHRKSKRLDI